MRLPMQIEILVYLQKCLQKASQIFGLFEYIIQSLQSMQSSQQSNMEQNSTCPICQAVVPQANFNIHKTRCADKAYRKKKYAEKKAKKRELKKEEIEKQRKSQSQEKPQPTKEKQLFQCHLCGYKQTMTELDTHFKNCRNRQITCNHCQNNFPSNLMPEHRIICQPQQARQRPLQLPNRRPSQRQQVLNPARRLAQIVERTEEIVSPRNRGSSNRRQNVNQVSQRMPQTHNQPQNLRQTIPQADNHFHRANQSNFFRLLSIAERRRTNSAQIQRLQRPQSASNESNERLLYNRSVQRPELRQRRRSIRFRQLARQEGQEDFFNIMPTRLLSRPQLFVISTNYFRRIHEMLQVQIRAAAQRLDQANVGGLTQVQIQRIPNKLYKEKKQGEKDTCCICYCDFEQLDQIKDLKCNHLFHVNCIKQWLKKNKLCPLCKSNVSHSIKQPEESEIKRQKSPAQTPPRQYVHESRPVSLNSDQQRDVWRQRWFSSNEQGEDAQVRFRINYQEEQDQD